MKASVKSIVITPKIGTPFAGNVRVDNRSRGVHDDLLCNIVILDNGIGTKVCFMGLDLCFVHGNLCDELKVVINNETKVPKDNIVITTTHTHSGPDNTDNFKGELSDEGNEYNIWLVEHISDEIKDMENNFDEVTLKIGKNEVCDLSFNRRLVLKDGSVKMNFEEFAIDDVVGTTGPIDPDLFTISIWDKKGKLKGVMVNFTLHPAVLVSYKWLVSRDYIDYLDKTLKNKYGDDVVIFFANGAEGNVNHLNYADPNQKRGFDETKRIGTKLGEYAYANIENAKKIVNPEDIVCVTKVIELPMRKLTKKDLEWAAMVIERDKDKIQDQLDGIPDLTYAREYFKMDKSYTPFYKTPITAVKIGDNVIATLPGEVFVEIGLAIKEQSKFDNTLVFGLANDWAGYVPNEKAFSEGGYEIVSAGSSRLSPKAGQILEDEVINLINKI